MNRILSIAIAVLALTACEKYDTVKEIDTDFVNNYEAFWNLVNDQYCFLGTAFNNDKDIDWVGVYNKWMPIVKDEVQDEYELFNIMGKSLDVLRDGHIWIKSDFKRYYNEEYYLKPDGVTYYGKDFVKDFVPSNYLMSENGKDDYQGDKSFKTRSGIIYGTIEREGKKFAYIYYDDFSVSFSEHDYKYINPVIQEADAIIFDIRDNPGGVGQIGIEMAGHFMTKKTLIGYSASKTGSGYDDFSEPYEIYCTPAEKFNWTDKQTALLTNRGVYSTANLFANAMQHAPNVIQVGQTTGGGGGLPMTHYLPNGWLLVFSSNILLDVNKNHIEPGIAPDYEATIGDYESTGKDGIVEKAIEELLKRL